MVFASRQQAAKQLAKALSQLGLKDLVLFALPRGGVALGAGISKELKAPLGVILVKKIGHPMNPEYAIGAIAEDEEPVYNPNEVTAADPRWLKRAVDDARQAITKRREFYSGENVTTPLAKNKPVALIDDGLATGLTMMAAMVAARDSGASRVVVAAPVASPESVDNLKAVADQVVVLDSPEEFKGSVGAHYLQFEQLSDKEVKRLLQQSFINLRQPTN